RQPDTGSSLGGPEGWSAHERSTWNGRDGEWAGADHLRYAPRLDARHGPGGGIGPTRRRAGGRGQAREGSAWPGGIRGGCRGFGAVRGPVAQGGAWLLVTPPPGACGAEMGERPGEEPSGRAKR